MIILLRERSIMPVAFPPFYTPENATRYLHLSLRACMPQVRFSYSTGCFNSPIRASISIRPLSVRRISTSDSCKLRLPLVTIRQQLLLVIQQLLPRLRSILRVRSLHDSIHRATLLAISAVNALCHVDIVACGTAGAVLALFGFNGDGLGGADGFAEFAGDAAFFTGGVAAEGVLAAEARGDGTLFEGVVDCVARRGRQC